MPFLKQISYEIKKALVFSRTLKIFFHDLLNTNFRCWSFKPINGIWSICKTGWGKMPKNTSKPYFFFYSQFFLYFSKLFKIECHIRLLLFNTSKKSILPLSPKLGKMTTIENSLDKIPKTYYRIILSTKEPVISITSH